MAHSITVSSNKKASWILTYAKSAIPAGYHKFTNISSINYYKTIEKHMTTIDEFALLRFQEFLYVVTFAT